MVVFVLIIILVIFVYKAGDRLDVDQNAANCKFFFKMLAVAADVFSMMFFWFMFGVCAGWFLFYKLQSSVFCMMPVDEELFKHQYD